MRLLVSVVALALLLAPVASAGADQNVPHAQPDWTPQPVAEAAPQGPVKYEARNPFAHSSITGFSAFSGQCPTASGHNQLGVTCIPCTHLRLC
jgi:hypothetical protein